MNWNHLTAFLWLRWRLMLNQCRRGSKLNGVLMIVLAAGALVVAGPLFVGTFLLARETIPKSDPLALLLTWDGLICAFLFAWILGVVTDLQRGDPFTLSKFLHLPVSVKEAFLINYASSLVSLSLILFAPIMLGYACALVFVKGALMVPVLPSLAAVVLLVTALTYQFQGWLASLMDNPRRRRTVITFLTLGFVLLFQLPNLINVYGRSWAAHTVKDSLSATRELSQLDSAFKAKTIDQREYARRSRAIMDKQRRGLARTVQDRSKSFERSALLGNLVVPVGWLPLGVKYAAEGNIIPSLLGCLGMTLLGGASLWRAYWTTIRLYQGGFTSTRRAVAPPTAVASKSVGNPWPLLLERRFPGVSEPVSVIALGGLRSLMRAPEGKMMLLPAVALCVCFGFPLLGGMRGRPEAPEAVRPLIATAGVFLVLIGMLQLMANQFGFDRNGFRVFVLSAASRRDILAGKNLTFLCIALLLVVLLLAVVQVVLPMRIDHLAALLPQSISMILLFCIVMNWLSIMAPMYIASGVLKPANPKLWAILLQIATSMIVLPLIESLTLMPLGIEVGLQYLGWGSRVPICLLASVAECGVVGWIYRAALRKQGDMLQAREQTVLECVTNRVP